jgi:hypothetical protein
MIKQTTAPDLRWTSFPPKEPLAIFGKEALKKYL